MLVIGGRDSADDPSSKVALLRDGRVLVLGGDRTSPVTAEIYDPARDAWSVVGELPERWSGHQAMALPDGRVLVTTKHRSMIVELH